MGETLVSKCEYSADYLVSNPKEKHWTSRLCVVLYSHVIQVSKHWSKERHVGRLHDDPKGPSASCLQRVCATFTIVVPSQSVTHTMASLQRTLMRFFLFTAAVSTSTFPLESLVVRFLTGRELYGRSNLLRRPAVGVYVHFLFTCLFLLKGC